MLISRTKKLRSSYAFFSWHTFWLLNISQLFFTTFLSLYLKNKNNLTTLQAICDLEYQMPFTNYVVSLQEAVFKSSMENMLNSYLGGPVILVN